MLHGLADMRRANFRTLALGVLVLAATGASAVYGAFFLIRDNKTDFLASRLDYLTVVADLKAASIRDFHRERISDLTYYASDPHLANEYREKLRGVVSSSNDVASTFAALINRGLYASVSLMDRRGRAVLVVPAGAAPVPPSGGPAGAPRLLGLRRGADGRSVLDYEVGTAAGARLLFRAYNVSWFTPFIERWPGAEKTGEVLLLQRAGNALLPLSELRHAKRSAPPFIRLEAGTLFDLAARGEKGLIFGRDYRGEPCYAVARQFPELGWILIVKADEKELLAPLRERFYLHLFAACGLSALLGALLLVFVRAQADRMRAEADAERRLLSAAIEQAGESVIITDRNSRIIYTNPAFSRASGYTREEARGKNPSILKSGRHDEAYYKAMWETLCRGDVWNGRFVNRRKDGALYEEVSSITPVREKSGAVTHYIAVKRDVSAIKSLEDQLFHSQKMEAIGRLAGGVAHDFNNILTTINGYAEMLADAAPPDSQLATDLAEVLGAGRRAALLTRQLLTFSRRAPADPVVADLRVQVRAIEKILRRTLGEDVRLVVDLTAEALWVRTDPGQIDQVLMNLAVNARDAMPRGGTLTVRAGVLDFATEERRLLEVIPAGRYAALVVGDDGSGMTDEVLPHIFEPFFTTKEKGKGTGLGLSTVFGIVKQNKGHITADSSPDGGSTFTVYLPLVPSPPAAPAPAHSALPAPMRGDETILVVEDQDDVLRMVSRVLTAQGYRVIACGGVDWALEMAQAADGPIHLLLTDVVMPGMGGEELAASLKRIRPETRVLYMSGYTDGRLDKLAESGGMIDLLLKPFTAEQLCRRVRAALDAAAPRAS